uniref:UBC core domain-containing protein n=1 Tax=Strongyloides stercoralis TaxID=6248 RepID=A0A0K0E338_STRER
MSNIQGKLLLQRQLEELQKNPVDGFSAGLVNDDNIYKWEVFIIGPPDTIYEEIWHPNIEKNGNVCISILHEPGDDHFGYERPEERWLPVHTVETILLSVISILADPNSESPANVDAAKEFVNDYEEFKKKVSRCVRKSQEE